MDASFEEDLQYAMNNLHESRNFSESVREILTTLKDLNGRVASMEGKLATTLDSLDSWQRNITIKLHEVSTKVATLSGTSVGGGWNGVGEISSPATGARSIFISIGEALAYLVHGILCCSAARFCRDYPDVSPTPRTTIKSIVDVLLGSDTGIIRVEKPGRSDSSMVFLSNVLGKYHSKAKFIGNISEGEVVECIRGLDSNTRSLLVLVIRRAKACRLAFPLRDADAVAYLSSDLVEDGRLVFETPSELLKDNPACAMEHTRLHGMKVEARKEYCRIVCCVSDRGAPALTLGRLCDIIKAL